jgi:membrane-associated phospholipid phosphatase
MNRTLFYLALGGFFGTAGLFFIGGYHVGFQSINQWASVYPEWIWHWITVLGDERVAFTLMLLLAWRYPQLLWPFLLAVVIATLYSRSVKELFDAARPAAVLAADSFQHLGHTLRQHSFPSGHSVTAGVVCGSLLLQLRWIEARILLILIAILIGISRIAVGAHWPVDVAAGLSGGFLAAGLGAQLAARWPAPAVTPRGRRLFISLAAPIVLSLLVNDGGYPQAALLLQLIGGTTFFYLATRF